MRCPFRKFSNFLICLAIVLLVSCLFFGATSAQEASAPVHVQESKTCEQINNIQKQQKEIKNRSKRIERKIQKRKKRIEKLRRQKNRLKKKLDILCNGDNCIRGKSNE